MAQIIQFKPKREVDAIENVNSFVEDAKGWNIFGDHVNWDERKWDMSAHAKNRATKAPPAITWTNFDTPKGRTNKTPLLQQPFLNFAKAYITYTQGINATKTYLNTLYAMRGLERALCNRFKKPCITRVDVNVLNAAQKLLYDRDRTEHKTQVAVLCRELEHIANFLNEHYMLKAPNFTWKHSVKNYDPANTVGDDFKKYRAEKLPTDTCIYALADIYNTTNDPRYILISAFALLLFSNPSRVGEVLTLDNKCLIHDHQGVPGALAMRWFPEKGAYPFPKAIKNSWCDLVLEAVAKIQEITKEARKIAKWYEKNPDKMYLPKDLEYLRAKEHIPTREAVELLCVSKQMLCRYLKRNNISPIKRFGVEWLYRFSDIEQSILSRLPDNFPYRFEEAKIKYSDSLFVVPAFFFKRQSNLLSRVMFEPVLYNPLANLFGTNNSINKNSMFDLLGYYEPDGSQISFPSHSARHWNETTSEYAHIEQDIRAAYAGRKKASQNSWYDHADKTVTSRKALEINDQSDLVPANLDVGIEVFNQPEVMGALVKQQLSPNDPFLDIKADVSDVGFCLLSLDQTCQKFNDHYLCKDHLYIKGDPRLEAIIPFKIEKLESDNKQWLKTTNGGKNPTVIHNKQVLGVLNNIMDILTDSEIPKGAFFRLATGKDYSKTRVIYYQKNKELLGSAKDGAIPLIKVGELCLST